MPTRRLTATDREMFTLAIPALGALIAEPLYVLTDTAIVGNIGTAELGGLGLAAQVIGTVLSVSLFLAYGTTAAVSRLLGAGRDRDAANQAVQGLWIAAAAGVVFAVICFVFAPQLLRILQASEDVEKFGVRYLRVSVFGFPAMLLVMAGVGYLRGLKDTRRPLYVALATAFGNLLLELFLVFRLGFGVGASALSTVIFQWVGAGFYLKWIGTAAGEHQVGWRPDGVALRVVVHPHQRITAVLYHRCRIRCGEGRGLAWRSRNRYAALLFLGARTRRNSDRWPSNGWHTSWR
jgi:putative MATE family efflux protein